VVHRCLARSEVLVVAHAVSVAPDVDDVAAMQESVDQGPGHEVVAEDLAPLVERLVRSENGRGRFVPPRHQLKKGMAPFREVGR
jgi:hypothetical protein